MGMVMGNQISSRLQVYFTLKQCHSILLRKVMDTERGFICKYQGLRIQIPLFIIYRALGIISDEEICKHIVLDTKCILTLLKN